MKRGEVIYNLSDLNNGEVIKLYSKNCDVLDNDVIDFYKILKENNDLYIVYKKKISEKEVIRFKKKIKSIYCKEYITELYSSFKLNALETSQLQVNENNKIRQGYSIEGEFENGYFFHYPNIVMNEREVIS